MTMHLDKAVNIIRGRFQNYKTIWVEDKDKEAVNIILDFINNTNNKNFNNNIRFAKLYAFCLGIFIERYKTTIDDPIPHKQLHELLDSPFDNIIFNITSELNFKYQHNILEAAGCNLEKHPLMVSESEKKENINSLEKLILLGDNKKLFFGNAWTTEEISEGIKEQVKNFINEL